MTRTKHFVFMAVVAALFSLLTVFTSLYKVGDFEFVYFVAQFVCVAAVCAAILCGLLMHKNRDIALSVCVGVMIAVSLFSYIYVIIIDDISIQILGGIIEAVGIAVIYYMGYARRVTSKIDIKRFALYFTAVFAMLFVSRFGTSVTEFFSDYYGYFTINYYYGTFWISADIAVMLGELTAISYIIFCDKPFAKIYGSVAAGVVAVLAIVQQVLMLDYVDYVTVISMIVKLCLIGVIAAGYYLCEFKLLCKNAKKSAQNAQTEIKPVNSVDAEMARLEQLKNVGVLTDDEYKHEVFKLLGGK